jgi:dephospho-CoA kinase
MTVVIGLTGNIGCGKTTIGAILQRLGAEYVDADGIVHALLAAGTDSSARVVERFGPQVANSDGSIDRRALGAIVFRSPEALRALEALLHPAVRAEIRRRIAASAAPAVVVDAIKLIESGLAAEVDSVWVVSCPPALQLTRLVQSRGLSDDEARVRIDAQTPQAAKVAAADVVIDNAGSREALEARVAAAYRETLARRLPRAGEET